MAYRFSNLRDEYVLIYFEALRGIPAQPSWSRTSLKIRLLSASTLSSCWSLIEKVRPYPTRWYIYVYIRSSLDLEVIPLNPREVVLVPDVIVSLNKKNAEVWTIKTYWELTASVKWLQGKMTLQKAVFRHSVFFISLLIQTLWKGKQTYSSVPQKGDFNAQKQRKVLVFVEF